MRQLLRNMAELACNFFVLQSKHDPSDKNAVSGHLGRPRLSDGPAPTILHYTALYYTALHCTTLHYPCESQLSRGMLYKRTLDRGRVYAQANPSGPTLIDMSAYPEYISATQLYTWAWIDLSPRKVIQDYTRVGFELGE